MQQQQDKEFDARLREKMEDFKLSPPASVWENIDREIHGPPVMKGKKGYAWLSIAASICVLVAAGFWLLSRESPFGKDLVSITGEQDTAAVSGPGVTILNNSRTRDEASAGAAREAEGAGTVPGEAGPSEKTTPSGGASGKATPSGEASPAGKATQSRGAAPAGKPTENAPGAQPAAATSEEMLANRPETEDVPDPADELAIAGTDPLSTPADASMEFAEPPFSGQADDETGDETDESAVSAGTILATVGSETKGHTEIEENFGTMGNPVALRGRGETKPVRGENAEGANENKNSLVPAEIKEISGVGEALNMVASAIDRSEDKFIRIKKDEDSGKWNGLRLDLGLVTISYNRPDNNHPDKKNRTGKN